MPSNFDPYLRKLNDLVLYAARRGFQLHRYRTIRDCRRDKRKGPKIATRYALHPLGLPRPARYDHCTGGLVLDFWGFESTHQQSRAYRALEAAIDAFLERFPDITHRASLPDYVYRRDEEESTIYTLRRTP